VTKKRNGMRSNDAIPSSPHATASPSMMQERERSLAIALTMAAAWLEILHSA
jgi:hypothetical protein